MKNKNDRQGIILIFILVIIILIILFIAQKTINNSNQKVYEFAKENKVFKSNDCHLKDNIGYCLYKGIYIRVDNYYEVEE